MTDISSSAVRGLSLDRTTPPEKSNSKKAHSDSWMSGWAFGFNPITHGGIYVRMDTK